MFSDVTRTRLEKQHVGLQALKERALKQRQAQRDTERFFLDLRNTCLDLAYIVHMGQTDRAGRPYVQHVLRVADKCTTLHGICAALVADVLENGRELGLSGRTLMEDFYIPAALIPVAEAMARRDGEPYDAHIDRVAQHFAAIKIEIESAIDNANIARFDSPTMADLDACSNFLAEAMKLKSLPVYQHHRKFEYLHDLVDLSKLETMIWADEYCQDDDKGISLCLYFGYESCAERRFTLRCMSRIHADKSVTMEVTTFTNSKLMCDFCIYRSRKTTIEFPCVQKVYEFMDEAKNILIHCPTMILKRAHQTLSHVTLPVLLHEKLVIEEIERKYA